MRDCRLEQELEEARRKHEEELAAELEKQRSEAERDMQQAVEETRQEADLRLNMQRSQYEDKLSDLESLLVGVLE